MTSAVHITQEVTAGRPPASAERRADRERCEAVAEAILRRWRIQRLAWQALETLDGRRAA